MCCGWRCCSSPDKPRPREKRNGEIGRCSHYVRPPFLDGHRSAALLGTRFTMAQPFYRERLERHGLSISVPTPEEQDALHQIIFDELVKGRVEAASRERFIAIMRRMHTAGAQAVILGCTEFGMLLRAGDAPDIPRVDTTELHCQAAVGWMLAEESGHKDAA